jgi:ligand-binding sensor domain-containing protein
MTLRLQHVLAILTLANGGLCLEAQTESRDWFFRAWQTEDGLPENSVSGIVQSPDGFLWVGTNGGASRFNGREFDPLAIHNIPDLPSRQVRSMFLDRSGRLWLAMERGPVIRIEEDSFHEFSADDGALGRVPTSMVDDPEGRLWIGYPKGLGRIEGNKAKRFVIRDGIPGGQHASLACDADGQVWLSNGGKLGRIHDGAFEQVRHFENKEVRIASARESGLWLAVGPEVMRLKKGDQFLHVADLPDKVSVQAILEDHDNALWIGTTNAGLFRMKDGASERIPTSHPWIDCITEDREGNIWAGTVGGGLNLITRRVVELHGKAEGLPFETVQSIDYDAAGRLWAVSQSGRVARMESGQWHELEVGEGSNWANCVAADPAGGIWIGTREQGLLRVDGDNRKSYGKADGLAGLPVRALHVARNGDVWIATDNPSQIHRLREGKISQIPHSRSIEAIRAMAEAADGSFWFGTSDGILFQVDGDGSGQGTSP